MCHVTHFVSHHFLTLTRQSVLYIAQLLAHTRRGSSVLVRLRPGTAVSLSLRCDGSPVVDWLNLDRRSLMLKNDPDGFVRYVRLSLDWHITDQPARNLDYLAIAGTPRSRH